MGGANFRPWEVGGDKPTGKEANSAAGKETPAEVNRTQQLPPSGMIEKPIAAAPSKKEVAPKPASEPAKAQAVREKTKEEQKTADSQRQEAMRKLNKEALAARDEIKAQISEREEKRDEEVKRLEGEKASKIEGLNQWKESQLININSAKADHIAEAERKTEADKKAAEDQHEKILGQIESDRDAAVGAVEAWCEARMYEVDPKNQPSAWIAEIVTDEWLASALKPDQAEPSAEEFLTPRLNAIKEERAERLAWIENDFKEKKKVIDDSLANKVKKADETRAAALKAAEGEAANAIKDIAETHATEVGSASKASDKEITEASEEAKKDIAALSRKMEDTRLAFASKFKPLKNKSVPVPKELLEEEPVREEKKPATAKASAQPATQVQPKKQSRARTAFLLVATAGTAAFASYMSPWKMPQRFVDRATDIASYFGGEKRLISTRQMESTARKLADIKRAKSAPVEVKPIIQAHVLTPEQLKARAERLIAVKRAIAEKKANDRLTKSLKEFNSGIATMRNQKGFLWLGKGSVSAASEISVTLAINGRNLSAVEKNAISDILVSIKKGGMKRKALLKFQRALKSTYGDSLSGQKDAGKATAKSKAKAVHEAAARVKAAAQPTMAAMPVPSAVPATAAVPIQKPVEASANQSASNPAEEKGPKKETIMTTAPMPGGQNATVKPNLLVPNYSSSGGAKPPWMDWANGIDNPKDYATTSQAPQNYVSLPGAASMTAAPTAGATSATLASAKVEGPIGAQSPSKKEDVTKPPEKLVDMAEHVKKEIARIDRKNAAKAAKGKKPETSPAPQVIDSSNMKKTTINCGTGKNTWTTEVGYHEGFSPKDNDPDLCDEEGRPKTIQEMATQLGVMKFPIRGPDSEGSK